MASSRMIGLGDESPNKDVKWMPDFLQWRYFGTFCPMHGKGLSKFCTICEVPLCPQCVKGIDQDHEGHGIVQISRFEGKEAVKSSLISNFIHCHDIQPYISNRTPVMVLHPLMSLEDSGSSNSSGDQRKRNRGMVKKQCGLCGNKLTSDDPSVRFCSIFCKVTAYAHSSDVSMPALFVDPTVQNVADGNGNIHEGGSAGTVQAEEEDYEADEKVNEPDEEEKQSNRRRGRKGTPHRAPFF